MDYSENGSTKNTVRPLSYSTTPDETKNDHKTTKKPKALKDFPAEIQPFLVGLNVQLCSDPKLLMEFPSWVDFEKVKKGQRFAREYYYGLNYAEMLSLMILFSVPEGLEPLVYTGKSDTTKTAHKRYLSTIRRVKSWYETEFWKEGESGFKNLSAVAKLHSSIATRLNKNELESEKCKARMLKLIENPSLKCPYVKSLESSGEIKSFYANPNSDIPHHLYFNQFEMASTQFGFFGLMLLYPKYFGAYKASDEELENFVHLWRFLGYLLGINDEFNICEGSLAQVKSRCEIFVEYFAKPNLKKVTREWEHMSRCAIEGINKITSGVTFEASLIYICWVLNVEISQNMKSEFKNWHYISFKLMKFFMCDACKVPGFVAFSNSIMRKKIEYASY